jgi:hypothetical protein
VNESKRYFRPKKKILQENDPAGSLNDRHRNTD